MDFCAEAEVKAAEEPAAEAEEKPADGAEAAEQKPEDGEAPAAEAEVEAEIDNTVKVEWAYGELDTLSADSFYLDVSRAGIEYGPKFRMLKQRHIDGRAAVLR